MLLQCLLASIVSNNKQLYAVTCIIAPCQCVSFLKLLSTFSLYLDFSSFTLMFLVVVLFAFILLGLCWGSWISKFIFFTNFGNILAMMSSNTFLDHSLSFSFCYFNYMHISLLDIFPQVTGLLGFFWLFVWILFILVFCFVFSFFPFFIDLCLYSPTLPFAISNLLLSPSISNF